MVKGKAVKVFSTVDGWTERQFCGLWGAYPLFSPGSKDSGPVVGKQYFANDDGTITLAGNEVCMKLNCAKCVQREEVDEESCVASERNYNRPWAWVVP